MHWCLTNKAEWLAITLDKEYDFFYSGKSVLCSSSYFCFAVLFLPAILRTTLIQIIYYSNDLLCFISHTSAIENLAKPVYLSSPSENIWLLNFHVVTECKLLQDFFSQLTAPISSAYYQLFCFNVKIEKP